MQQERVSHTVEALLAYRLSDLLEAHKIEMVLVHAKCLKAISYAKAKTDIKLLPALRKLR